MISAKIRSCPELTQLLNAFHFSLVRINKVVHLRDDFLIAIKQCLTASGGSIKSSGVKLDDKTKAVFLCVPIGLFIFDAAKLLRRKMIKKKVGRKKIKKKKKRFQLPLQR